MELPPERIHHPVTHRVVLHLLLTSIAVDEIVNKVQKYEDKRYKPTAIRSFTISNSIFNNMKNK